MENEASLHTSRREKRTTGPSHCRRKDNESRDSAGPRTYSLPGYTGDFLRSPTKQFVYAPGHIVPDMRNLRDVEVVGITRWLDNRLPIESVRVYVARLMVVESRHRVVPVDFDCLAQRRPEG